MGFLPLGAVAWHLGEESFIKDNASWIDMLKIRLSYGANGNNAISRYQSLDRLYSTNGVKYIWGDNSDAANSAYLAERRYRQSRPALGDHLYGQPRYRLPVLQRPSGRYDRHVPLQHARPADVAYRSHYERLQQDSLQRRPDPQQGYRTDAPFAEYPQEGFQVGDRLHLPRSTATRSSRCAATAETTSTTRGSSASRCRSTTTGT